MLETLTAFSNLYGRDADLVLAGGGNTSAKEGDVLYIKASGTSLGSITPQGFVAMDRRKLAQMLDKSYPEEDAARESAALADLMEARLPDQTMRPSVETLLHALFPMRYVLHLHPALVNGMTCGRDGAQFVRQRFPNAVWMESCKPGYILAKRCKTILDAYKMQTGRFADTLFLQNHGVFFAADDADRLDTMLRDVLHTLRAACPVQPDFSPSGVEDNEMHKTLTSLYGETAACVYCGCAEAVRLSHDLQTLAPLLRPFTPDHIVYCKAHPLYLRAGDDPDAAFAQYARRYGDRPKIVWVQDSGFYALADSDAQAKTAAALALDAVKIAVYSACFGGAKPMDEELTDFITHWEVEAYRAKQSK